MVDNEFIRLFFCQQVLIIICFIFNKCNASYFLCVDFCNSIDQGTWDRQAVRFCHLKVNLSLPRLNRAGAGQFVEFRSGIDA